MFNKEQKPLSADIYLKCFICNEHDACNVCIFEWNGFSVRLCLCPRCVMLNKQRPTSEMLQKVA
jgi:hypothetical protein